MADRLIFPSLIDPDHAYTIHESGYELSDLFYRTGGLASWAGMFQTYGDGLVQHSPEWPAGVERFEDYLASLATFLLGDREPDCHEARRCEEATLWLARHWPSNVSAKRVRFLATVKYTPEKRRWLSLDEDKLSTAESRRHDKRWIEVPEYADGGVEAVYRLAGCMDRTSGSLIAAWANYNRVREIVLEEGGWGRTAQQFFGLEGDDWMHDAFEAVRHLAEAQIALENARCRLGNWTRNAERNRRAKAEAASATA